MLFAWVFCVEQRTLRSMILYIVIVTAFSIDLLCPPVQGEQNNQICKATQHQDARDDILNFFKAHDGLNITWLHAVNSPPRLEEGLSGEIMMFEADVLMRNNQVDGTPVMAHPPDVDSNLTLADFLNQTIGSTKGIKLDFKTIMVVKPSLKMLQNATSGRGINNPIWLNADILPGPCYDKVCTPVDHVQFLSLCTSYFPQATLSISWTTGMNMTAPENYYNWTQVIPMGRLVSQIAQPITFPIRAVLVQRSSKQIHWLLDLSETFTLTIWSSKYDKLDVQDLVTLRQTVTDKRRIYYDLPPDQDKTFKDALKSADSGGDKYVMDSFAWKAAATKRCEDVLVGRNSVMISGDGGEVISVKTLYKVYAQYYLFVSGICSFIESGGVSNEKRSIKISLHVSNTTGIVTSSNTGKVFSLALHSNGAFQLSMNGGEAKEGSVKSETGSFKFSIVESSSDGKQRTFKCEITAQDSKGDKATVSLETEDEPMAGHLLIGAGKQPGAVLVENVEFAAAAAAKSGVSTGNHYFQKIIVLWALLFSLCQM